MTGVSLKLMHRSKLIFKKVFHTTSIESRATHAKIKMGGPIGTLTAILKFPDLCVSTIQTFLPCSKDTVVKEKHKCSLIKDDAENEKILTQSIRMLTLGFHLTNAKLNILLLLVYLKLRMLCRETHPFVQNFRKKCFNSLINSSVNARRQTDESSLLSILAETMKRLANCSNWCEMMDLSRHTMTE